MPLVVELAYVISRLHKDTFPEDEIDHKIIFMITNDIGDNIKVV